ncbi:MBOAT family O-acyltransferase [Prosthecobacter sp.]|uniref:MBOAT family O-acyltransferase n=1 Tax=Prosthecobacter sp. TaxID=1965333 RepID=UPI00378455EE
MLFHTLTFWVFFAVFLSVYWRLGMKGQNLLLLLATNFFYGWWDWRFLPLIWYLVSVDYVIGRQLGRESRAGVRKALVALSLVSNLGLLFVFKYLNFFAGETCQLAGLFGQHWEVPFWIRNIILPLGISFHTFQTISYVMDVYRRRTQPVERWLDYALFCGFFPQLLAGPIERGSTLMPQLFTPRPRLTADAFAEGFYHLMAGLFKKVVVADNLAVVVNHIFSLPAEQRGGWEVLLGAYAFAFQVYGDFSGYSSMAQGIARWMGFTLSWNFKMPFLATSPQVFWQRWHITLSTWLRDYFFMPLMRGTFLQGLAKVYAVTLVVQLASGVWHGANWTYFAWGLLHGVYLCAQLWLTRLGWFAEPRPGTSLLRRMPWILLTFHLMCVGMILFRASSITQAAECFAALGSHWTFTPLVSYGAAQLLLFAAPLMLFECWMESRNDPLALLKAPWPARTAVYACMLLMIWFLPPENTNEFIYFQF